MAWSYYAVRGRDLLHYVPLSILLPELLSFLALQVKLRCARDQISMNTLKFHQGRLENLDDLTGYRYYTENILPLPESTINAAVRDAVYVPLPTQPGPSHTPPDIRTPPRHRELRPKPATSLATALQCDERRTSRRTTSCTGEQGQHDRLSSLGLRANKDWDSFLLPERERSVDMEKLAAEIRRLEASCRRHNKGPDTTQANNWDWTGEIPLATARMSASLPGVSVWHIDELPDRMQDMEASNSTDEQGRSTDEPTTPTNRHSQEHGQEHGRLGANGWSELPTDPLPSFDCFLQTTFDGASPWQQSSQSNVARPSQHGTVPAEGSGFPGPLKSRHELESSGVCLPTTTTRTFSDLVTNNHGDMTFVGLTTFGRL